jgi:uncharacterized protein (UPF0548 family)
VYPDDEPVSQNATIVLYSPVISAAARVIYVVEEANRFGFAYGTLPAHPEIGEESFVLSIGEDDVVRFEVRVFSRAGSRLARMGGPVTRLLQRLAVAVYAYSMKRAIA